MINIETLRVAISGEVESVNILLLANVMNFYIFLGLLTSIALKKIILDDVINLHLRNNKIILAIKATPLNMPISICFYGIK